MLIFSTYLYIKLEKFSFHVQVYPAFIPSSTLVIVNFKNKLA